MDQNDNSQMPPQEPPHSDFVLIDEPLRTSPPPPKKKTSVWRIIVGVLFVMSLLANMFLVLMLIGMAVFFAAGYEEGFREDIYQSGPRDRKIAVVTLDGIIDDEMSEKIIKQIDRVRSDRSVKAMILEINSPGGGVSASDKIYNEVSKLANQDGIHTVACMRGIAASGGYYSAVGCESIVAEPTTITGSIGVIMSSFVVQELLENKLGIQPVVITAGGKKDWPSPFHPVTDEQRAYLEERLIQPAYKRFVDVVKAGRKNLSSTQVDELADGSIYTGEQAQEVGLVDEIGYMQEAIKEAMRLAGLEKATVVKFREPYTLAEVLLGAEGRTSSMLKLDRKTVYELSTPQLMYLWSY